MQRHKIIRKWMKLIIFLYVLLWKRCSLNGPGMRLYWNYHLLTMFLISIVWLLSSHCYSFVLTSFQTVSFLQGSLAPLYQSLSDKPSFSVTNTSSLFLCYSVILETVSPSSHHSFSYSSKYFKLIPISYHILLCLSTSHEWCIVLSAATTWVKTMTTTIWEQI